jgi:hypothetical protein
MLSLSAARTLPRKTIAQAASALGDLLPPGFLLGLVRGVSKNVPLTVADQLLVRSSYRLHQLQAAVPRFSLPSASGRLLEAISGSRRRYNREELALAQALFEFYVGLILHLLASGGLGSSRPYASAAHGDPLASRALVLNFSPRANDALLKCPQLV